MRGSAGTQRNEGIDIIRAVAGEMVGRERTRRTRYEAAVVDSLVISIGADVPGIPGHETTYGS